MTDKKKFDINTIDIDTSSQESKFHVDEDPSEIGWFHPRYHTSTYVKSYGMAPPAITGKGAKLAVDDKVPPPDHCRPAGRP